MTNNLFIHLIIIKKIPSTYPILVDHQHLSDIIITGQRRRMKEEGGKINCCTHQYFTLYIKCPRENYCTALLGKYLGIIKKFNYCTSTLLHTHVHWKLSHHTGNYRTTLLSKYLGQKKLLAVALVRYYILMSTRKLLH